MPSTNYTIDDVSPMIQYAPASAWSAGDKTLDSSGINYSNNGTFTLSTTKGSSASFSFSGTQVWIFGAKRSNHGPYTVALDGKSSQFDGFSEDDDFTALFDSGPLKQGQHKVVITNAVKDPRKPFLDVDYITWSTDSDSPNITLEDTTPQFSYQPSNSWKADLPSDLSGFQGDSGHVTQNKNASATLRFSGNAVSLFGPIGPSLGSYAIEVDGKSVGTFNATKVDYEAQQMLFLADDLGAGDHTLRVINQPSSTNQLLAIDFASVAGLPSQSASVSASPTISASASASASTSASTGGKSMGSIQIVGYIAAVVGSLCLIASIVGVIYRQKHKRSVRREAVGGTTDVAAFTSGGIGLNPVNPRDTNPESETAHLLDPRSTAV